MSSTHLSLHFHVVFSTKNREPRIAAEWCERLHAYLGGVARESGSIPEAVGGVADHTPSRPIPEPPSGGPVADNLESKFLGASQSRERRGWRSQTETMNRKETLEFFRDRLNR